MGAAAYVKVKGKGIWKVNPSPLDQSESEKGGARGGAKKEEKGSESP